VLESPPVERKTIKTYQKKVSNKEKQKMTESLADWLDNSNDISPIQNDQIYIDKRKGICPSESQTSKKNLDDEEVTIRYEGPKSNAVLSKSNISYKEFQNTYEEFQEYLKTLPKTVDANQAFKEFLKDKEYQGGKDHEFTMTRLE